MTKFRQLKITSTGIVFLVFCCFYLYTPAQKKEKEDNLGIYMGRANIDTVYRPPSEDKWVVSEREYSETKWPRYMSGSLYVISMSVVKYLALDCPYHCSGLNPLYSSENSKKPCFWKFEDVFIGSCIFYTQRKTNFVAKQVSFGIHNWGEITFLFHKWTDQGIKPVHVHQVKTKRNFRTLFTIISLLEKFPHKHPIKKLLHKLTFPAA